ncbi:hypothetical protein BD830_106366 [Maritimibacter alkaliphilus HTCC2654]|uniref:Uncharacterized protein n=1 Tax=Maritimibacter alkaliphilus HTCC2654 TaxID=314271 RepID=A3V9W8_9RHOB|nr:hypothetical protein [Maritimibacter alkaliphilus]EAQ14709.1 hypothetical protein RB2654_19038 [Maritimibacter alkaliphilus HTCC2654]TYP81063.1 hypothetical protein BD830_106366 [Maritimibacter alkaliphilus HTCC2654]
MNTQKHKIEFHYEPPVREVDNLEAMIADAARDARDGLRGLHALSSRAIRDNELNIKTLTDIIEQKRILTDQFRHTIRLILANIAQSHPETDEDPVADTVRRDLLSASYLSQRVSDLIEAEQMIGKKRQSRN